MKLCHVKLLFIAVLLVPTTALRSQVARPPLADCSASPGPCVDKIDPPDWWAGLPSPMLLLHGTHLREAKLGVKGHGVSLEKAQVSDNGHWAFLWLRTEGAGAQRLQVLLTDGKHNVALPFTLAARVPGGKSGFSSADAMYLIFTDRFANGDPSNDNAEAPYGKSDRSDTHGWHGGDLRGITQHVDYLQHLGVNTVWITPAYENSGEVHAYHGYDATDIYAVDPHFGKLEDYKQLASTLHARNMKLVLDLVPNHVGPAHIWANDPPTPGWLHGTPANHVRTQSNFETIVDPQAHPGSSLPITNGWFSDSKPDLNQDDPLASKYLIQNAIWWIETAGLDGLRLDTFPYVQRTFWHDFHATLHGLYPHLTTVGEIYNHHPEVTSFFAGGVERRGVDTGLDTPFDFPMFSTLRNVLIKGAPMTQLADVLHQDKLYPHPERLVPFLGNHDTGRFLSEPGATIEELAMGYGLVTTLRGMPELYAGDEIAMRGGKDPDNRRDFPGGFPGDPQNAFTQEGRTPEQQTMFQTVSTLLHLRAQHPALLHGQQVVLHADEDSFFFLRAVDIETGCHNGAADDRVVVAANRSSHSRDLQVSLSSNSLSGCSQATPLYGTAASADFAQGHLTLHLAPMSVSLFEVR
jgi:glycosidase